MKKKLIFCICMMLCVFFGFSTISFSAHTYDCDVEVTSASVLVANLETDTFVYEKGVDTAHFISYLSNIMTYIVARNNVADIEEKVKIESSFLDTIPNPDNTLDKFAGKTLTVKDLLHYIMLTNGNDACYVLADYVSKGDINNFVELMNKKARDLGCAKTKFSSPASVNNTSQFSTCADLYKIVKCALDSPDYTDISSVDSYIPDGYKDKKLTIVNTNSLLRQSSPYYFRHVKNGKYGNDNFAKANIVGVSKYKDVSYACIILSAQRLSEHNAFTETKQLLTWAYTSLDNKRIITKDTVLAQVTAESSFGSSDINLTVNEDVYRTMPADFDQSKFTFVYDSEKEVKLPVFAGQNMGTAKMYYNGEYFEDIELIADSSDGVAMLSDLASFANVMFENTLVSANTEEETEETKNPTEKKTDKTKATKETTKQTG